MRASAGRGIRSALGPRLALSLSGLSLAILGVGGGKHCSASARSIMSPSRRTGFAPEPGCSNSAAVCAVTFRFEDA